MRKIEDDTAAKYIREFVEKRVMIMNVKVNYDEIFSEQYLFIDPILRKNEWGKRENKIQILFMPYLSFILSNKKKKKHF